MTRARQFFEFLFGSIRDPWSWLFVAFVLAAWVLDVTGHDHAAWLIFGVEIVTIVVLRATKGSRSDQ